MCSSICGIDIRELIGIHVQLIVIGKGLVTEGRIDIVSAQDIHQGKVSDRRMGVRKSLSFV